MTTRAIPTAPPRYDRHRWEAAVIAATLHPGSKLVALTLAHYAGTAGFLPAGHVQNASVLAEATGLDAKKVRLSLSHLERNRFISRPDIATWVPEAEGIVRPVTLTQPPATAQHLPPSPRGAHAQQ